MGSERPLNPIAEAYLALMRIPPGARVIAGLAWVGAGIYLTLRLWSGRVISGLCLFVVLAGVILTVSGVLDIKRRRYRESVRGRAEELIRGMLDAKRRGKKPLEWLKEEGIHDAEIRAELLRAMNQRLSASKSSAEGGAR